MGAARSPPFHGRGHPDPRRSRRPGLGRAGARGAHHCAPQGTPRGCRAQRGAGAWRRSSLLLDQACRANGIERSHFLQPNQYVIGSQPLSEGKRVALSTELSDGSFVPEAYPLLQSAGEERTGTGVRFQDLTLV